MNMFPPSQKLGAYLGKARASRGFTLIELIVVIGIMVTMMALAGNLIFNKGKTQGLQSAVESLDGAVQEARLDAIARSTWTRLVIVAVPDDTSPDTRNLRQYGIMYLDRTHSPARWVLPSRLNMLPLGFYFSPTYSTLVDSQARSKMRGFSDKRATDLMLVPPYGKQEVYYVEFDPEGRVSYPTGATRMVVCAGSPSPSGQDHGMETAVDNDGRPITAGGFVLFSRGNTTRMRTREQIKP